LSGSLPSEGKDVFEVLLIMNNTYSYKPYWYKHYSIFIVLNIVALFPVVDPKIEETE
jgi:hypothetical protein